jgi:hypothetical protein
MTLSVRGASQRLSAIFDALRLAHLEIRETTTQANLETLFIKLTGQELRGASPETARKDWQRHARDLTGFGIWLGLPLVIGDDVAVWAAARAEAARPRARGRSGQHFRDSPDAGCARFSGGLVKWKRPR